MAYCKSLDSVLNQGLDEYWENQTLVLGITVLHLNHSIKYSEIKKAPRLVRRGACFIFLFSKSELNLL